MKNIDSYLALMTQAFHDRYDIGNDVWTSDHAMRDGSAAVLKEIGSAPINVLDIGAGKAIDAPNFLRAGHSYFALDLVEQKEWETHSKKWSKTFKSISSSFQDFEYEQNTFDLILDSGCFHHQHSESMSKYLEKTSRLLRPSGKMVLLVYTPNDPLAAGTTLKFEDGRFAHVFDEYQLRKLVQPFGFKILRTARIPHENGFNFYLQAWIENLK